MSSTSRARLAAALVLGALVGLCAWSYLSGGLAAALLDPALAGAEKVERLRAVFASAGPLAPLLYVGFVTLEVILAPIPGTLLYLPGGAIFGGWWGGTLSLLGNTLGAGGACLLARGLVGRRAIDGFFERRSLRRMRALLRRRGWILVALLRANPLSSSDLVSYAAGAAGLSAPRVMFGTLLGMAPLCYVQAHLAETLLEAAPWLLWPLLVCGVLYLAAV
ncbi:MAG: TVP38/TMEM64 family protein, partial [Planctomycetes bacterium]|nr:TVP38/TMEM64 family protein [Planctomycetota bacterium]